MSKNARVDLFRNVALIEAAEAALVANGWSLDVVRELIAERRPYPTRVVDPDERNALRTMYLARMPSPPIGETL